MNPFSPKLPFHPGCHITLREFPVLCSSCCFLVGKAFLGYPCLIWFERDTLIWGFQGGSVVKNPPDNARDTDSIPESGRSPGVGNGNLFQYSCLGNSMDRGDWQALWYPDKAVSSARKIPSCLLTHSLSFKSLLKWRKKGESKNNWKTFIHFKSA